MNDDTTPFDATSDLPSADEAPEPTSAYEEDAPADPPSRTSGRHPVSIGHLVMGVAFLGIVVIWALYVTGSADSDDLRWLTPLPWLGAGIAGLIAVIVAPRRRARQAAAH